MAAREMLLSDNLFSAVVILTVAITTGIMTVRIKNLEEIAATQIDEDEEAQIRARTQEVEELLKNDIINLNSVSTH